MRTLEEYAEELEVKKMMTSMILTALGFVVAFQWRDVIKETMDVFLPAGEGLVWKWIGAVLFTLAGGGLAVLVVKLHKMNIIPDELEPQKVAAKKIREKLNRIKEQKK